MCEGGWNGGLSAGLGVRGWGLGVRGQELGIRGQGLGFCGSAAIYGGCLGTDYCQRGWDRVPPWGTD